MLHPYRIEFQINARRALLMIPAGSVASDQRIAGRIGPIWLANGRNSRLSSLDINASNHSYMATPNPIRLRVAGCFSAAESQEL